jgi:hypothetical protein
VDLLRQTGPRTLVWVVILIGVAAIGRFANFSWWLIGFLEFVSWCFVAFVERALSGPREAPRRARPTRQRLESALPLLSYVRVLEHDREFPTPQPEPGPDLIFESESAPKAAPALQPDRAPEPEFAPLAAEVPLSAVIAAPPAETVRPPTQPPERQGDRPSSPSREVVERDAVRAEQRERVLGPEVVEWDIWILERIAREQAAENEELSFLVVYLRDYATTGGLLPANFDSLVRESFGSLLSSVPV